jgi:hypothetical protein
MSPPLLLLPLLLPSLLLLFACPADALDNGLALTPPRGFRTCASSLSHYDPLLRTHRRLSRLMVAP